MRRVALDVDTGIDDALALLYAVACPALELVGVTAVAGNVPVEVAARNSAAVLALAGADHVPVAMGAGRTTTGSGPRTGPSNHGPDGLGGVAVVAGAALSDLVPESLVRAAVAGGPCTLVGLAPMTNLATTALIATDVVVLGGELVVEDEPELNASHDARATAAVLGAPALTTVYVNDVFERVSVAASDVDRLRSSSRPRARLAGELLAVRRSRLIGDAGALVLLSHPELFTVERRRLGMAGGRLTETGDGRLLDVVVDVDAPAAARAFVDTILA